MSRATSITSLEPEKDSRAHNVQGPGQCTPMPLPSLGTQRIIHGNGTNVGTIISLQCPDHHSLIGGHVVCEMSTNSTQWVGETYCKPVSLSAELGFRVAVYASALSCCIILVLSMAFITCCLHERFSKTKRRRQRRDLEEQEWLRDQCAGGRAGYPRHHGRNHNNNNNNSDNSNRQQKAGAMRWGGHDGAFVEDKATHGSSPPLRCDPPSPAPLPGKGFYPSPVTTDTRPDQGGAAGPLQNSQYPAAPPVRSVVVGVVPGPRGALDGRSTECCY